MVDSGFEAMVLFTLFDTCLLVILGSVGWLKCFVEAAGGAVGCRCGRQSLSDRPVGE